MTVHPPRSGSPAAKAVIAAVLLGAAVWVALNSALFAVREVRVLGARGVPDPEILSIAAVEEGDNLIMVPTTEVAERLEDHPWIEDAAIDRHLPATLLIRITERRPSGWVEDPDGPVVVAGDGTVLERRKRPPQVLPRVGVWPVSLAAGDRIDGPAQELRISSAMSAWLLRRIASADLDDGDVMLELREGGLVSYGAPTEVGAKNRALARMLRWAEERGMKVRRVDVRVPSAPSLEPAAGRALPTPIPTP